MNRDYLGFVYRWTNTKTNKKYIGLHVGNTEDGYIGSGKIFKRDVKKYGINSFTREILYYEYASEESLYIREYEIINEYDAVNSKEYYNLTNYQPKSIAFLNGRKITRTHTNETKQKLRVCRLGTKHTQETKVKMAKQRKGRFFSQETRCKLSEAQLGDKNHNYGKKWCNNGSTNKLFPLEQIPNGWKLGRIGLDNVGQNNPFYGKTHSDETKHIMSISKRKHNRLYENTFVGQKHTE